MKAEFTIVPILGIVIVDKFAHCINAYAEMVETVLGMTYELSNDAAGYNINVVFALLNKTPFTDEKFGLLASTVMLNKLVQLRNAGAPMLVREAGIARDVKLEQLKNAFIPTVVKEAGNVTDVKLEQL